MAATTGARAILFDLGQFGGLELAHGIGNRAVDSTVCLDPGCPQSQQGAHPDSAADDRIRPRA